MPTSEMGGTCGFSSSLSDLQVWGGAFGLGVSEEERALVPVGRRSTRCGCFSGQEVFPILQRSCVVKLRGQTPCGKVVMASEVETCGKFEGANAVW